MARTGLTDTQSQVQALCDRWADAERRGDAAALSLLLDDDFRAVGPLGFILTRDDFVDRHRSGALKYQAFAWEDAAVRDYGCAALVIGTQRQQATYQGHPVPGDRFRVTLGTVQRDGRWYLAGLHMSAIAPPPEPSPGR